ncbi:MAG: AmmeMemoRadiSam system protein A [Lachnospiraceae bacterium]|nr:AmmeMemoRadiSam system protein A [Lachnospiraceae bacterium]
MPVIEAYMVPHPPISVAEIGQGEERKIQATLDAFNRVAERIADIQPDTIIVTSPHATMYSDYFHISPGCHAYGDFSAFRTPGVSFDIEYDTELAREIADTAEKAGIPAGMDGERDPRLDHGVMVPLYFINKRYTDYRLVRIGLSGYSLDVHKSLGRAIDSVCSRTDKKIVLVASGDLSHCQKEDGPYGYRPEGPIYDAKLMDVMKRCALSELTQFDESLLDRSQECGHRSFVIMSGVLHSHDVTSEVLSHEATFGVGYGIAIFRINDMNGRKENTTDEREASDAMDAYVKLARDTIYSHVKGEKLPEFTGLPEEMLNTRAGAFVSVHEFGMLRGCIGTISATCDNVAEEIRENAVSAVSRDPRFSPVRKDELDNLEINVDILGDAEPISSYAELDVKKYGVIVTNGMRRGLLLPDLDGVDTVEQQVDIARQKAGIDPSEEISLERFEVVRHV